MATKKSVKKSAKPKRSATSRGRSSSAAPAAKVKTILAHLRQALQNARNALGKLSDAQTDAALKVALGNEIEKLDTNLGLADDELSKGVGEGKQTGPK